MLNRKSVISELAYSFYECNCKDEGLLLEWIRGGETLPGFDNMTDDELVNEWNSNGLFGTTLSKTEKDSFTEV